MAVCSVCSSHTVLSLEKWSSSDCRLRNGLAVGELSFAKTVGFCKASIHATHLQAGDVPRTFAEVDDLITDVGFRPNTSIDDGIAKFVQWFLTYYKVNEVNI